MEIVGSSSLHLRSLSQMEKLYAVRSATRRFFFYSQTCGVSEGVVEKLYVVRSAQTASELLNSYQA